MNKMKISKLISLLAIPVIAWGLSGKLKAQDSTAVQEPKITGNFSSKIKSHFVAFGYVLGKGPHKQDQLSINHKNLSAFVWSDYDFGNKNMAEIDWGVSYSKEFKKNLSASTGFAYMHYPAGDDDKTLSISLNQGEKLKKNLKVVYFMKDKEIQNGIAINGKVTKTFKLPKNLSTTASLSGTYLENFYGDSGISNATSGIDLNYTKENISLSGSLNYQFGFIENPEMLPPAKNQLYGGVSLSVDF